MALLPVLRLSGGMVREECTCIKESRFAKCQLQLCETEWCFWFVTG